MTSPLDPDWTPTAGLRAEIERLTEQLKLAVWSDSEECKFLTKENERLRAAVIELTSHDYVHGNAAFRNACRARAKAALADQEKA